MKNRSDFCFLSNDILIVLQALKNSDMCGFIKNYNEARASFILLMNSFAVSVIFA